MRLRLCVPEIHVLLARNWNRAASGASRTASSVAKRVAVSTPLRTPGWSVMVMELVLSGWVDGAGSGGSSGDGRHGSRGHRTRGRGQLRPVCEPGGLLVEALAQRVLL